VAVRRKRSISVPPDLDAQILAEAAQDGVTYSAWLTTTARKELMIRAGLSAVAEVERELGRFTDEELADAEKWARETIERSRGTAAGEQQAA
jgi:hypothetical protein